MKVLRQMRTEAGLSADRLAALSGLHRGHIYAIERGRRRAPTVATVRAIAEALAPALKRPVGEVLEELTRP
ncbi:MAG TPA: helix-turn-helix transcriptional regulator [Longimicrobiales bacterium]